MEGLGFRPAYVEVAHGLEAVQFAPVPFEADASLSD